MNRIGLDTVLLIMTTDQHSALDLTRRSALFAGAAGAGVLALAACSSSSGNKASDGDNDGDNDSDGAGAKSAAQTPTGGADTTLASLDSIKVGEAVSAKLDGKPVIVARPTATTAACFSAICTHQGCTVKPAGAQLHCPCHGSVYNAVTGAVISGPAPTALPAVPVHVADGNVVTGA